MRRIIPNSKLLAILMLLVGMSASAYDYDFKSGRLYYKILSEEDRTVEVIYDSDYRLGDEYLSGDLEIPQKVVHFSKTYKVTSIGDYAFKMCSRLTSVTLPNTLTSIGISAFCECTGLTSVTLPNSLTSIISNAFWGCSSLESLNVEAGNMMFSSIDGVLYNNDVSKLIICPAGKSSITTFPETLTSIGDGAFLTCAGLTSLTLPNSLASIGDFAFYECTGLTSVTLPNSLISIGEGAFSYCSSLTSMMLPDSVASIGVSVFWSCSGMTYLTLPASLSSIGDNAFWGCSSLESILIQCLVPIKCNPCFSNNVVQDAVLYVPVGTLAEYEKVDPWRNFWNIKEMNFSGIERVEGGNGETLRLSVNEGVLTVSGINSCEIINIYDMEGHCVYTGTGRCIDDLCSGIYIIKAGHKSIKFAI